MKNLLSIGCLMILIFLGSCGNNAAEKAALQQHVIDSLSYAMLQQTDRQKHKEDSLTNILTQQTTIRQKNINDSMMVITKQNERKKYQLENEIQNIKTQRPSFMANRTVAYSQLNDWQKDHWYTRELSRQAEIKKWSLLVAQYNEAIQTMDERLKEDQEALAKL